MPAGLQGQGLVHLPGGPQAVPLGDGPPGMGQHVCPVLQGLTRGPGAEHQLTHRLGPEPQAPGPDGQHQIHTLGRERQWSVCPPVKTRLSLSSRQAYLDLAEGHEESEGLIEVGAGRALPGRCLSPLPFPLVQHELDLHVGLWAGKRGWRVMQI